MLTLKNVGFCFKRFHSHSMGRRPLSTSRLRTDGKVWIDAHSTFIKGGNTLVQVDRDVDTSKTWEEVEYDETRENLAKDVVERETIHCDEESIAEYEERTCTKWNEFYQHHKTNFFKDRKYLIKEFSDLCSFVGPCIVMDVGCGVGNTLYPLLTTNLDKRFWAFDCSQSAIENLVLLEK
eukprot:TRINITY_DN8279_c0_g1_i2.p1 TRINITY_DN8279_c0_g1~~TRINITY_DN8279_c0_g1_i2.p1  ORF type:complete len:179 (-),score=24.67 TRINITY_DN8279_c0_g1_i2:768-1304(-)